MIIGTGIDIVDLQRIKRLLERQPKFIDRVLTLNEITYLQKLPTLRHVEFIAGRYAAKEALSKAIGCGIGASLSWKDVSILPNDLGAPSVHWSDQDPTPLQTIHVSLSHNHLYAIAQVIIDKNEEK